MYPLQFRQQIQQATLILALTFIMPVSAHAEGDAEAGKIVFKKCMACHKIGEGAENSTGPVLTGVIGRKAGTYPDYRYGKSMRQAAKIGFVWDEEKIDEWLQSPKKFLRKFLDKKRAKAKMKLKLKKAEDRANVIAYLKTFSPPSE